MQNANELVFEIVSRAKRGQHLSELIRDGVLIPGTKEYDDAYRELAAIVNSMQEDINSLATD